MGESGRLPDRGNGYTSLLKEIKNILSEGKERARLAVEFERVRTYWEAGGALRGYLKVRNSECGRKGGWGNAK